MKPTWAGADSIPNFHTLARSPYTRCGTGALHRVLSDRRRPAVTSVGLTKVLYHHPGTERESTNVTCHSPPTSRALVNLVRRRSRSSSAGDLRP